MDRRPCSCPRTDARLIVVVACRRGQGLGSVLEEQGPFILMLIMAGTNDLAMGVAPDMVLHSIQALHAVCQMGGVGTVGLGEPQSFFTFEESGGTTGANVDVCGDAREARLADGTLPITAFQKGSFKRRGHRSRPCALSRGGADNLPCVLLRFGGGPVW